MPTIRSDHMLIEILTEDKSGSVVVKRLVERICEDGEIEARINVRPHRGCGSLPKDPSAKPPKFSSSLLDLLPAKCRAYNKVYRDTDTVLVVIMDSDDNDPDELRKMIYDCVHYYAPSIRSVIGLCTEEVEAWMLGDKDAVMKAFPEASEKYLNEYVQDSICGTWEALCKVICPEDYEEIIEIGYPAVGNYKARWAEEISRYMEPELNISPSFINFKMALNFAIRDPKPISGHRIRSF